MHLKVLSDVHFFAKVIFNLSIAFQKNKGIFRKEKKETTLETRFPPSSTDGRIVCAYFFASVDGVHFKDVYLVQYICT